MKKLYELYLSKREIKLLLEYVDSDIENAEQSIEYKEKPLYMSQAEFNHLKILKEKLTV